MTNIFETLSQKEKDILRTIRKVFLDHLGREGAAGLCHSISVITMDVVNRNKLLGAQWIFCEGRYKEEGHYWLEAYQGDDVYLLDMTSDQFGIDAPYLTTIRPANYKLEINDPNELERFLDQDAASTWKTQVNKELDCLI